MKKGQFVAQVDHQRAPTKTPSWVDFVETGIRTFASILITNQTMDHVTGIAFAGGKSQKSLVSRVAPIFRYRRRECAWFRSLEILSRILPASACDRRSILVQVINLS